MGRRSSAAPSEGGAFGGRTGTGRLFDGLVALFDRFPRYVVASPAAESSGTPWSKPPKMSAVPCRSAAVGLGCKGRNHRPCRVLRRSPVPRGAGCRRSPESLPSDVAAPVLCLRCAGQGRRRNGEQRDKRKAQRAGCRCACSPSGWAQNGCVPKFILRQPQCAVPKRRTPRKRRVMAGCLEIPRRASSTPSRRGSHRSFESAGAALLRACSLAWRARPLLRTFSTTQ